MKKIIGVIPARYNSSRFKGKPLAEIEGKPMVWWVYQQALKVKQLNKVIIATDDIKIKEVCEKFQMDVILTKDTHKTPTDRIHEVSEMISGDYYVAILGDEPLIEVETIEKIIPNLNKIDNMYVGNLMTKISEPSQVIDFTNLKIVTNNKGKALYISRSPIPYPKGSLDIDYQKFVGVGIYSKQALDFYVKTPRGKLEIAEDNDFIRFLENDIDVYFTEVLTNTLSVDTEKDLEEVRKRLKKRGSYGV